jgi:hypothetical protein
MHLLHPLLRTSHVDTPSSIAVLLEVGLVDPAPISAGLYTAPRIDSVADTALQLLPTDTAKRVAVIRITVLIFARPKVPEGSLKKLFLFNQVQVREMKYVSAPRSYS